MIRVKGVRQSGKTTYLLKIAQKEGWTVVVPNHHAVRCVREMADNLGINDVRIISADEFFSEKEGTTLKPGSKYLIDELDWFLGCLGVQGYSNTIDCITISRNDEEETII